MLRLAATPHKPDSALDKEPTMPRSFPATLAIACFALAGGLPMPTAAQQAAQPVRQRDVITREEIEAVQVEDAYQVVLRLRPEFLNRASRPQPSVGLSATSADPDEVGSHSGNSSSPSPGGFVTATRRAPDPDAPEFDREGASGRTAQAPAGGGGFAGSVTQGGGRAAQRMAAGLRSGAKTSVVVYVGSMLLGGIEELTTLPTVGLQEIRFLSPSEAQFKFGPRHGAAAVILVTLK
jgi:hypothetical protein